MSLPKKRPDIYPRLSNRDPHPKKRHMMQYSQMICLKLLHQILPDGPHSRPLTIYIHGDRKKHATELNAANSQKSLFAAARLEPVGEEEGEDEAVEDVCVG